MPVARINMLIVDSQPFRSALLSRVFAGLGHRVRCAEGCKSAIEQICAELPDVILADLNLSGMSGLNRLATVNQHLPFIYILATAHASSDYRRAIDDLDYPFNEAESNMRYLMQMLNTGALPTPADHKQFSTDSHVWMASRAEMFVERSDVLVQCPECMHQFRHFITDTDRIIQQACCRDCRTHIYFALIHPADQNLLQMKSTVQ